MPYIYIYCTPITCTLCVERERARAARVYRNNEKFFSPFSATRFHMTHRSSKTICRDLRFIWKFAHFCKRSFSLKKKKTRSSRFNAFIGCSLTRNAQRRMWKQMMLEKVFGHGKCTRENWGSYELVSGAYNPQHGKKIFQAQANEYHIVIMFVCLFAH